MKPTRPPAKAPATADGKTAVATGNTNHPAAGEDLPLPHERDESVGSTAAQPDPVVRQAKRDLDAGLVDTDMHGTPGMDDKRRKELLRGGAG